MEFEPELFLKFTDPSERFDKVCPKCGSNQISFIHYGSKRSFEAVVSVNNGEIINRGCKLGDVNLLCKTCGHEWASIIFK